MRKSDLPYARLVSESDQLRTANSLPFIMQESGAKRPAKLPQRESTEENDRADTLSRAIQPGPKVQCDEAEIEDKYDTDGRVTRYGNSSS